MKIAEDAAGKSNCLRRKVGAAIILDGEVVATGWNGVSGAFRDCAEAGCQRCIDGADTAIGYEQCICIHAEQKAIAEAAFRGVSTNEAVLYVTLRPCRQCLAIARAAGISGVVFDQDWTYPDSFEKPYRALAFEFSIFGRLSGGRVIEWVKVS